MKEQYGPLFEMQQSAKNKRLCADQCRKAAIDETKRAEKFEKDAEEYERAAKILEEKLCG